MGYWQYAPWFIIGFTAIYKILSNLIVMTNIIILNVQICKHIQFSRIIVV